MREVVSGQRPRAGEPAGPPRLADGVELLGEFKDSGYREPPSLIRRADGQVIQMSRLLYLVASLIDGTRAPAGIAEVASRHLGRTLTAEQVGYVIDTKLRPLGIIAREGPPVPAPTASPLLALRARRTLLPERAANIAGTCFRPLFRPPVIVAVIVSVAAVDYWLLSAHGLSAAFHQVLNNPADLLFVAGLTIISAMFHECGHAAGCRYGGARPGRIGVGIYLVWPAFFTNVTDSYRLSRAGRLRTDLGGVYFNLIFILALAGIYEGTSSEVLLLVIAVTHLEMLEQLLPFIRFDGYFILSDIVGVPDLFARVAPVVKSALPHAADDPRVTGLRPRARVLITSWVLSVITLLIVMLGYFLLRLPDVNRALWHSASQQAHLMSTALAGHHFAAAAIDAISIALAVMSIAGSIYVVTGLGRRVWTLGRRWSAGRPARRLGIAATAIAATALLAIIWAVQGQFEGW
jgi:putative peptide zinc metalloprotease protein